MDEKIILKWIFGYGLNSSDSGQGPVAGFCEHGNEPFGSVKGEQLLDWLNDCQLLMKDSLPWN
jgi:hypothetical protein